MEFTQDLCRMRTKKRCNTLAPVSRDMTSVKFPQILAENGMYARAGPQNEDLTLALGGIHKEVSKGEYACRNLKATTRGV